MKDKEYGIYCQHVWNRRFGHRDPRVIKDIGEKESMVIEIIIKDCGRKEMCEYCIKGKMSRKPFPKAAQGKWIGIFDLIHTDVCGPMQTITPKKERSV